MGGVNVKIDDRDLQEKLGTMIRQMEHTRPAMQVIGEIALSSIQQNFEEGGRPSRWQPLADATIEERTKKGKWPGTILVRSGAAGGLLGAIYYEALDDRTVLYANKVYAAIHHFGGEAGRGRKVKIPARPYMMIQDEDWDEMLDALQNHVFTIRGG